MIGDINMFTILLYILGIMLAQYIVWRAFVMLLRKYHIINK